jgi:hypothetical protein
MGQISLIHNTTLISRRCIMVFFITIFQMVGPLKTSLILKWCFWFLYCISEPSHYSVSVQKKNV